MGKSVPRLLKSEGEGAVEAMWYKASHPHWVVWYSSHSHDGGGGESRDPMAEVLSAAVEQSSQGRVVED